MTTIQHQTDLVEAYALGGLEPHEQASFEAHVGECAECRDLAHATEETAQMLALVVQPATPPLRCKRTVLGRIEREQFLRTPTPRRATRRVSLSTWTAMAAVCAMMLTGGWAWSMQGRLERANSEIAEMSTKVAEQATQAAQMQQQLGQFIGYTPLLTDGEPICWMKNASAKAKCFARPGENRGLMVVSGLAPLPAGQTYQLWLAHDNVQAPIKSFNTHDGNASVDIVPPEPLERYTEIMITVENEGDVQQPSDTTVLSSQF